MTLSAVDLPRLSLEQLREYEMEEARRLQRAMVPSQPLRAHPVEIVGHFRPAAEVGGDFLDYFLLSDRTVGLYVGDVVGKGLPAAIYAALAMGTLRGINKTGERPSQVLEVLNRRLRARHIPARYCAVQYALFDPSTRLLYYANAGLPGPVHISARGCCELRQGGFPSGMFEGARYELNCLALAPGDAVLFITDGLTEAVNLDEEDFGVDRLLEICARNRHEPAQALLERISEAVDEFMAGQPLHDDMTLAVFKLDSH